MLLKDLCEEGYLLASGIGKGTKYVLKDKVNAFSSDILDDEKGIFNDDGAETSKVSKNVASKFSKKENKSEKILNLYMSICEVCADEFMSLMDIAPKVGRSLRYLKNNVIPEMVNIGLLDRKYPNVPSHPDQKYKKSGSSI